MAASGIRRTTRRVSTPPFIQQPLLICCWGCPRSRNRRTFSRRAGAASGIGGHDGGHWWGPGRTGGKRRNRQKIINGWWDEIVKTVTPRAKDVPIHVIDIFWKQRPFVLHWGF